MEQAIVDVFADYLERQGYNLKDSSIKELVNIYLDCQDWDQNGNLLTGMEEYEMEDWIKHTSEVDRLVEEEQTLIVDKLYAQAVDRYRKEIPDFKFTPEFIDRLRFSIQGKLIHEGEEAAKKYVENGILLNDNKIKLNSEKEIDALVAAGDWDIFEEGFKKFQSGEKIDNTLYFGKVDYGNHTFNFYIDAPSNEGIYVQFVPEYNIVDEAQYKTLGQLEDKKFVFPFQEDEEYELESFLQYEVAYDPTSHDSGGVLPCKEENLTDLETFKSSVVQKLLEDEMITRDVERYMFLKENGKCFHQQYVKARDNYLADMAREDKLPPEAIEGLAAFYRNEYYNFEDIPGSVEKIVSKMNEAGFSDARIKLMFSGMPKSVQEEMSKALGPAMKKLHNQEIGHNSPRAK